MAVTEIDDEKGRKKKDRSAVVKIWKACGFPSQEKTETSCRVDFREDVFLAIFLDVSLFCFLVFEDPQQASKQSSKAASKEGSKAATPEANTTSSRYYSCYYCS